jgi:pantothenate kinase type III
MSQELLLADLGNSRLKLALATRPTATRELGTRELGTRATATRATSLQIRSHAAFDADARLPERLASLGPEWSAARGALSSVARPELEQVVADWMRGRCAQHFALNPPPALRIATREPERTGRDRVYGACGAWERLHSPCLSVDCGTALTVNLVRVVDALPEFAGGAIAAGAVLLSRALSTGGARLFEVVPRAGIAALGDDTRSALEAGVVHGLRGAARELCERIEAEHGGGLLPVALTGGARALLAEPAFVTGRVLVECEFLVLAGLAASLDRPTP